MSYTIAQAKVDLQGIIHGTSLNKIQGLYTLMRRAASDVLLDIDPRETVRISQLSNAIYDQVFDYGPLPTDLKSNGVIDFRPQAVRSSNDNFGQQYGKAFDLNKENNKFTIQSNSGIKTLRASKTTTAGKVLQTADSLTDNGTWSIGGAGSNLGTDSVNKVSGSSSISFDVSGASSSYIENSTMTAIDLSSYLNQASIFVWVYFPDASQVTNVDLRWGSSGSNYYNKTVTTSQSGVFINGWNLLRFDWNGSIKTGTPVNTAINYLRLTITHTASNNVYRVDNFIANLPTLYELVYYSNCLFQSAAGVWKDTPTADDDIINLEFEAENLFLYKTAEHISTQIQQPVLARGKLINFDQQSYGSDYDKALITYKARYKSEITPVQQRYHKPFRSRRFRNL